MKAIVYHRYGSPEVLEYAEVEKPVPHDDQVLIRVRAASVNPFDWHLMHGEPFPARFIFGLRRPKNTRLGVDVAGRIEAVGGSVTQFKAGDEVFGSCRGAFAEYACAPESAVVRKPANSTFEQAAAVPIAGFTALQGLRKGQIQPGHRVLINGAAGGVGTFAVQLAKWFGAEVTGVCSARNVDLVRSIGADRVIDYTQENFTIGPQRYDLILDCIGNHSLLAFRRVLHVRGIYVMVGVQSGGSLSILGRLVKALALSGVVSQKLGFVGAKRSKEDLTLLRDLIESGKITPVIDHQYRLSDAAAAMAHLGTGHARGKVIITVSG